MVSDRGFLFHIYMYVPWSKTLSLVPKSRSSFKVKVKYQVTVFEKNGRCGDVNVSQTQRVYFWFMVSKWGTSCLSKVG